MPFVKILSKLEILFLFLLLESFQFRFEKDAPKKYFKRRLSEFRLPPSLSLLIISLSRFLSHHQISKTLFTLSLSLSSDYLRHGSLWWNSTPLRRRWRVHAMQIQNPVGRVPHVQHVRHPVARVVPPIPSRDPRLHPVVGVSRLLRRRRSRSCFRLKP